MRRPARMTPGRIAVSQELLNKAAEASLKENVPQFDIGDTVNVSVRIVEGDKERVQVFTGTVIARQGSGVSETFTVRRLVNNEGVERVFPIHSPKVAGVEVVRSGKVRRAKLYYLRDRVGKATRLKEDKAKLARQQAQAKAAKAARLAAKAAAAEAANQAAAEAANQAAGDTGDQMPDEQGEA